MEKKFDSKLLSSIKGYLSNEGITSVEYVEKNKKEFIKKDEDFVDTGVEILTITVKKENAIPFNSYKFPLVYIFIPFTLLFGWIYIFGPVLSWIPILSATIVVAGTLALFLLFCVWEWSCGLARGIRHYNFLVDNTKSFSSYGNLNQKKLGGRK